MAGWERLMAPRTPVHPRRALAQLVAAEMVAEVCTVYAMRPGDLLELTGDLWAEP